MDDLTRDEVEVTALTCTSEYRYRYLLPAVRAEE
jgi:hypothetical protein